MPPQRSPASSSTENEMIGIGGESGSIRVWSIRVFSKDREMYGTRRVKPKITNPSILDSYLSLHSLIMARGFPFSFFFFLFFFFFFFEKEKKAKILAPLPGIEPGSPAWQAGILTTILQRPDVHFLWLCYICP